MKKIFCTIAMLSVIISAVSCGGEPLESSAPPSSSSSSPEINESEVQVTDEASTEPVTTEAQTEAPTDPPTEPPTEAPTDPPTEAKSEFNIGETWVVDGQWELTVTGVTETEDRNPYSDKTPASVYIIDYTYTNIGYEHNIMDGLYIMMDDTIVDSNGTMGYRYPGSVTNHPQQTPVGATCNAQTCIGVDNPGPFKITVKEYDGNKNKQTATFYIEP